MLLVQVVGVLHGPQGNDDLETHPCVPLTCPTVTKVIKSGTRIGWCGPTQGPPLTGVEFCGLASHVDSLRTVYEASDRLSSGRHKPAFALRPLWCNSSNSCPHQGWSTRYPVEVWRLHKGHVLHLIREVAGEPGKVVCALRLVWIVVQRARRK